MPSPSEALKEVARVDQESVEFDGAIALFSESNSRFIVTGAPEKAAELEIQFAELPITKIGTVVEEKKLSVKDAVEVELDALVKPFKATLHGV
jgi:phosphoribosylformylglycinamidine (FGAM) synthase-like enzyme